MRMVSKVIVGVAVVAMLSMSVGGALADPINAKKPWKHGPGKLYYPGDYNSVTPRYCDVVGSGANTTEYLFDQYSLNYNTALLKAHKKFSQTTSCKKDPTPFFYSWDALQNSAVTTAGNITPKPGCPSTVRPNGSTPGISALADNVTVTGHKSSYCFDYARSARARKSSDPTDVTFVPLALDNVTYATVSGSNAPKNLTTAQLAAIYSCADTNWDQVGGPNAPIVALLPQSGSGILTFFLTAIGGATFTPGPCVQEPSTLEQNQGVSSIFTGSNAVNEIIPFSAGKWVAQAYHSPGCSRKTCLTDKTGVFIKCNNPKKGQNDFGCDVNGKLVLGDINGTSPTKGSGSKTVLNPKFTSAFVQAVYAVVRGTNSIPKYLEPFFGRTGKNSFCSKSNQKTLIPDYGFEANPECGVPGGF
jgi:ABC-type phosphate transport system substrate-binding protein